MQAVMPWCDSVVSLCYTRMADIARVVKREPDARLCYTHTTNTARVVKRELDTSLCYPHTTNSPGQVLSRVLYHHLKRIM